MTDLEKLEGYKWRKYNTLSQADKNFLIKMGVINGVGPESYGWLLRYIMTLLFGFIDYSRHDYSWFRGEDFHHSNRGLLKWSYISLAKRYKNICKMKWYKRIPLKLLHFVTLPFKSIIIDLAFDAVESKAGKEAYKVCKGLGK